MPTIPSIRTSVENQNVLILDEHAKNGTFLRDARGRLIAYTGGFSVVFPYQTANGEKWAFRCWHSIINNTKKRYEIISDAIKKAHLNFLCDFRYIENGINVEGHIYPITRMRWIDGITIKDYICQNRKSKVLLTSLADNFLKMTQELHDKKLAHGDLQHGNILVDKNHQLHLVDYDSFYCPQLKGDADTVTGLVDYQHPSRNTNKFVSEKLDYFSELIIYLSILAISKDANLVERYKLENADRLLFCREDFNNLRDSRIFKDISALGNRFQDLLTVLDEFLIHKRIDELRPFMIICAEKKAAREEHIQQLLDKLKNKYSDAVYKSFIRYHYKLLESADSGNASAQYKVGEWFYTHGSAGESDSYRKVAVLWYKKAAIHGHIEAQFKLALCYQEGNGVYRDKDEAIKWYKKAADNGSSYALHNYIELKYSGKTYESVLRYRKQLLFDADSGKVISQFFLGEWFRDHDNQSEYKKEAVTWYTKAANNGHGPAMFNLGQFYEKGIGVHCDYEKAIYWYKKAANSGYKPARLKLVESYLYGRMVSKDVAEAVKWLNKIESDVSGADLCNIGYAYETGDTITMDKAKAVEYYRKAAEKGEVVAQNNLGICYEYGNGVPVDLSIAKYWYEKAASQGSQDGKNGVYRIETKISVTHKKPDFWDDCLWPASFIAIFILFIYSVLGIFFNWPIPETSEGFTENNKIFLVIYGVLVFSIAISMYENND